VLAGCLRNAGAVADWAAHRAAPVTVLACGERWPDGSLRPAVEDLLGAGAILALLGGTCSPEVDAAVAAFSAVSDRLTEVLAATASGRELIAAGFEDDIAYAGQLDASGVVPLLGEGAFRPA
jgi:2-phosphosulfolactate phosphatase